MPWNDFADVVQLGGVMLIADEWISRSWNLGSKTPLRLPPAQDLPPQVPRQHQMISAAVSKQGHTLKALAALREQYWKTWRSNWICSRGGASTAQVTRQSLEALTIFKAKTSWHFFESFIIIRHDLQCSPLTGADPSRRQASQEHITSPKWLSLIMLPDPISQCKCKISNASKMHSSS